jgi:hypothetical protein
LGLAIWDEIQPVPRFGAAAASNAQLKSPASPPKLDTKGVPLPERTPYEGEAELKAAFIEGFCDGYRAAEKSPDSGGYVTRCGFGPEALTARWQAADAGWNAGQAASNKRKRLGSRHPS